MRGYIFTVSREWMKERTNDWREKAISILSSHFHSQSPVMIRCRDEQWWPCLMAINASVSPSRNTKIIENKILLQNIFSFVFFFSWIQKFLSAVRQFQERKESEKSNASNTNSERKKIVRMHSWVPSKDHRKGYLFYFWPRTVSVNPTPNLSAFDLKAVVKREILHHVSTKLCAGRVRDSPDDWRRRNVKFYEIQTPFVGGSTGRARFSTNSRGAISFFRRLSFIQRLHQISFFFEFNLNYECGA